MAEFLVSVVLEQLASIIREQAEAEVKLVRGVDKEVEKLTSNLEAILAVIEDAESQEVREKSVRNWLDKLKDATYDIDDVLDEWSTSVRKFLNASKTKRKVCSLVPSCSSGFRKVGLRHDIAEKIKELNRKLDIIADERKNYNFSLTRGSTELRTPVTTSFIDVSYVHGRDDFKDRLLTMLLNNESSQEPLISVISIVGMGGIGKTTLARLVFNNDRVSTHFHKKIWVCVSEPFSEIRVAKAILESLGGDVSKLVELQTVLQHISQSLKGEKFILVLDDVWTEDPKDWEQLKGCLNCCSQGSRILVTTRKTNVANVIGTTTEILLETLPENDSWNLFSQIAFSKMNAEERKKFEDIGRKLLGKCKGLPLAIKTLGSLLCYKSNIKDWKNVLDSEIWELKEVESEIFRPLLLSYYDLPSTLRKCFSYCAVFPKDYEIDKDQLIKLWMAQSYVRDKQNKDTELIGEEYFESLAMRSFFQDFERDEFDGSITSCKMHDIVNDFAQYLTKNECFSLDIDDFGGSKVQFSFEKGGHLLVRLKSGDSFPMYNYSAKSLRSLLVGCEKSMNNVAVSKLFCEFTCLRTLDLSYCGIRILSSEIKKLIHLRCLDLSHNEELEELPKATCELYNLQTLNLDYCMGLKKLPQGMGKLINLRHLLNDCTCYYSLTEMPKGIEGLTCLRTLTQFGVCRNRNRESSGLEYLKNLNNLRGSLAIIGLGDVGDVGEVNKAKLMDKTNLVSLRLYFRKFDEVRENRSNGIDEAVLEALQPPPNLERLLIGNYEGKTLWSNWMVSLTKLKFLLLRNCINLEEWDITKKENEDITTIMPSLHSLEIENCEKLKSLPDQLLQTPTLKKLKIYGCPILKERYKKHTGVDWIKISYIPEIDIHDHRFLFR